MAGAAELLIGAEQGAERNWTGSAGGWGLVSLGDTIQPTATSCLT